MPNIERNGTGWTIKSIKAAAGTAALAFTAFFASTVHAEPPASATAKLYVFNDTVTVVVSSRAGSFVGRGRLEEGDFGTLDLTPLRGSSHVMIGRNTPSADVSGALADLYVGSGELSLSDGVTALVGSSGSGFRADSTFSAEVLQVEEGFGLVIQEENPSGSRELASGLVVDDSVND